LILAVAPARETQMSHTNKLNTENFILRSLSPADIERVESYLVRVDLPHGLTLNETQEPIEHLYFPNDAVISVVSGTESGQSAEAGLVGREGLAGVEALLNGPIALHRQIIQLPGDGYRAELEAMRAEFAIGGAFHAAILLFTRSLLAQMSQTALCNRMHIAEQRLAKWLLMCRDRASSDVLGITQEFAAMMLGSNRVTLTQAAGQLQEHGLIEYRRGNITIVDRKGLEKQACECYSRIKEEYERYQTKLL